MSFNAETLMEIVETLPIELKVKLVEKILASMQPVREEIDRLWAKEAEKRLKDIKENKIKVIEEKSVFEETEKIIV